MTKIFVLIIIMLLGSCTSKCDYNEFYNCFNKEFVYEYSNSSNDIYDILSYKEDCYIHTTIINDSIMSDTNTYEYNRENGQIIMDRFIFRYNQITGDVFLNNGSGALSVQFECNGISWGDIYYRCR